MLVFDRGPEDSGLPSDRVFIRCQGSANSPAMVQLNFLWVDIVVAPVRALLFQTILLLYFPFLLAANSILNENPALGTE